MKLDQNKLAPDELAHLVREHQADVWRYLRYLGATRADADDLTLKDLENSFEDASEDFRFATSVASFGMLLRNSEYCGTATYDTVLETASSASSRDPLGYRAEFLDLVRIANGLQQ